MNCPTCTGRGYRVGRDVPSWPCNTCKGTGRAPDAPPEATPNASDDVEVMGRCATCHHLWESHTNDAGCAAIVNIGESCKCPGHEPYPKRATPTPGVAEKRACGHDWLGPSCSCDQIHKAGKFIAAHPIATPSSGEEKAEPSYEPGHRWCTECTGKKWTAED